MKITKSQLKEIIKEEIATLNEAIKIDEKFIKLAFNEFGKKNGLNLSNLPFKKVRTGLWAVDISKELTKNHILSTLFKSLSVELYTTEENINESDIRFLAGIYGKPHRRSTERSGENFAVLVVDKQSGKVKYISYR